MPNFLYCVKLIEGYNKDIENCKKLGQEIKDGPWKNKFYGTLKNLLREIIFTKDNRLLQKQFADRVHTWSKEQINSRTDVSKLNIFSSINTNNNSTMSTNPSTSRLRAVTYSGQGDSGKKNYNENLKNTPKMQSHKRQNTEIKITNLLDEINFSVPSTEINQIQKEYEQGHRSKHPEIDPPSDRLTRFKKKQLQFEDPSKVLQKMQDRLPSIDSKVTYPKPVGYIPKKEDEMILNIQQQNTQQKEQNEQQDQAQQQKAENGKGGDIIEQMLEGDDDEDDIAPQIDEKDKNKMIPDKKAFINNEIHKQQNNQLENQKPGEIKSIFRDQQSSNNYHEMRMEQKWLQSRHNDVRKKREDEEIVKIMNDFAQAKNKINRDINNKIERQLYGSQFKQCEYRPRNYTMRDQYDLDAKIKNGTIQEEDIIKQEEPDEFIKQSELRPNRKRKPNSMHISSSHQNLPQQIDLGNRLPSLAKSYRADSELITKNLEYKIGKQKIGQARKLYGHLININKTEEEEEVKPQVIPSLSVYSKNLSSYLKPFSAIFDKLNPDAIQNEQLEEIHQIKNRFAFYKINIPIKKLMDSISIPQPISGINVDLPQPGQGLMENPFFEQAKKKKKKK